VFDLDPIGHLRAYERSERELNRRLEVIRQLRDDPSPQRRLRDALYLRLGDWLIRIGMRLKTSATLAPPEEDGLGACANWTSPA
jgi:hypothetical protein